MSTRVQGLIFAIGKGKQPTVSGTPFGNVSPTFVRYKKLDDDPTTASFSTEDDAAEIGKGNEFASAVYPVANDFATTVSKYGTAEFVTHMWAYALGNVTVVGSGAPYAYTCVPLDPGTSLQNPLFSVVAQLAEGGGQAIDNLYLDCAVEEVNFTFNSGPGRQSSKCSAAIQGSGKTLTPSGITVPGVQAEHHMLSQSMSLAIDGVTYAGTGFDPNRTIISGSVGWKNNLMTNEGYFCGSGLQNGGAIRARLENGSRSVSFDFEARLSHNSDEYSKLIGLNVGTLALTVQYDSSNSATWTFTGVQFKGVQNGSENGLAVVKVSVMPLWVSGGILTFTSQCGISGIAQ